MPTVPAEWSPHRAMWLGYPSHGDLWCEDLEPAREEVIALARALAGPGREHVKLLVHGDEALRSAERHLGSVVTIVPGKFGDIWLRDTGPLFFGGDRAVGFRGNGWGGKYDLPFDDTVALQLAAHQGAAVQHHPFIVEGGALDHDGQGTVLTTRQCLLNANRNAGWTEAVAERALRESIGARRVIWLGDGLLNDHTDGHVDNLARFVAPGVVAVPCPTGPDDPNAGVFAAAAEVLAASVDAEGKRLKVVRLPSPGRVTDDDGEVVPASHMNFLIANGAVIVPTYGDEDVAHAFAELVPGRAVICLPSTSLLTGGGSFHCITQQVPA